MKTGTGMKWKVTRKAMISRKKNGEIRRTQRIKRSVNF